MTLKEAMEWAVLDALASARSGLTRTELLARVLHYRALPNKFLFFSVRELWLLKHPKGPRHDEAEALLRRVLGELTTLIATPEMQKTLEQRAERREKRSKKEARRAALFTRPPPPAPVVLKPARRELVAGSPMYSLRKQGQRLSPLDAIYTSPFFSHLQDLQLTFANAGLAEPIYRDVPAETVPHPYEQADREVRSMMTRYPSIVWSRLPVEREMQEDEAVMREYEARKRAVNRAVNALSQKNKVELFKDGASIRVRLKADK